MPEQTNNYMDQEGRLPKVEVGIGEPFLFFEKGRTEVVPVLPKKPLDGSIYNSRIQLRIDGMPNIPFHLSANPATGIAFEDYSPSRGYEQLGYQISEKDMHPETYFAWLKEHIDDVNKSADLTFRENGLPLSLNSWVDTQDSIRAGISTLDPQSNSPQLRPEFEDTIVNKLRLVVGVDGRRFESDLSLPYWGNQRGSYGFRNYYAQDFPPVQLNKEQVDELYSLGLKVPRYKIEYTLRSGLRGIRLPEDLNALEHIEGRFILKKSSDQKL